MTNIVPKLVSVIIPVYNRIGLLREAVESALVQSYQPIEVIIVDDGSTDEGAIREIECLVAESPDLIRSIRIPNNGPGLARQAGLNIAQGEFIQYLDSDDLLLQGKLQLQVAGLKACPECALSYGKMREYVIGTVPKDIPSRRTGEKFEKIFPAALRGRLWATETPLYRRSALDEIGPWLSLRILEDWEYECRLGAKGAKLHYCEQFVSEVRHHAGEREGLRWTSEIDAFKDMLSAHLKVLDYALEAGGERGSPAMRHYARNLFRLARDAGRRGLNGEAVEMLDAALDLDPARNSEYRLYRTIASVVGWKRIGSWSESLARRWKHPTRADTGSSPGAC